MKFPKLNAQQRRAVYILSLGFVLAASFVTKMLDGGAITEGVNNAVTVLTAFANLLALMNVTPDK